MKITKEVNGELLVRRFNCRVDVSSDSFKLDERKKREVRGMFSK